MSAELASQLQAEKEALNRFTASMEEEFLELGTLLRKIISAARQVRNRSDDVIAAASGRAEDAAIQFAFQLLKKAEDLVRASREQHTNLFEVFEKMHLDLLQVARERGSLMRALKPLETTKIYFRILACSLDEKTRSQFVTLSEAIAGIVKDVQTAVGQRFDELERAGQATGELVTSLAATDAEQKRETDRMLEESRNHLSRLNEVLLSSGTIAESISQAGANIASGVSTAIVALQCQDMARQKFEHIGGAIDEMKHYLEGESAGGLTPDEDTDCHRFLAEASRVQLAQLQSVFEQLDEAARQVKRGLQQVDSVAKTFADYAVRSGDATLDGQIIGRAVKSIHAVLAVIDHTVASVGTVAQLVVKLKSTFSDCTSQILRLARKLRSVALNAQIFASQVDAGTALDVVARNTRMIAEETMQQLDEISSRVTQLVDLLVDLEQRLNDHGELAGMERDLLAGEAEESEKKLDALEHELRTAVGAIGPLERELSDTIRRTTECIRFPDAIAKASARSTGFFEGIILQHSHVISSSGAAFHHKVQELQSKYTMAHERDVHDSVVADHPAAAEVSDDQLAENVELF